jgi:hypothetical protein
VRVSVGVVAPIFSSKRCGRLKGKYALRVQVRIEIGLVATWGPMIVTDATHLYGHPGCSPLISYHMNILRV